MATIKITRVGRDLVFREGEDRNGPSLIIPASVRFAALDDLTSEGEEVFVDGQFSRVEDWTSDPIAVFADEADADAFLATKGPRYRKAAQDTADGFNFVIRTA